MESISKSAEQLGYSCLSAEQQKSSSAGAGKSLCYLVLPIILNFKGGSPSINPCPDPRPGSRSNQSIKVFFVRDQAIKMTASESIKGSR